MFNESQKVLERIQKKRMRNIIDVVCDGDRIHISSQLSIDIRGIYTMEDMQKMHEKGEFQ
ncbi:MULTISPECIES: hypothetical protein [Bacillus]|uniref:hypothetical protein n=1 Tax=Bacillus TaxID=1386 RepID=UPI000BF9EC0C|nr:MULTISPECIES: hypothetical protein [Bacillus]MCP1324326.1 hypothetical protein [Bacillus sp. S0628]PGA25395.1 hypothetical protein COL80_16070 [Bacillus thuringiensis]PGU82088.1 hypothetical protein COD76_11355 [Bacillus cereus]